MKLTSPRDSHAFLKRSYGLLSKYHSLERRRASEAAYGKAERNRPAVALLADSYQKCVASAAAEITDPELRTAIGNYQSCVAQFCKQVESAALDKRVLASSLVGDLLRAHTSLARLLREKPVRLVPFAEDWADLQLLSIIVWPRSFSF